MAGSFSDNYFFIRLIGEGSFSEVLEVRNKHGEMFAAKKLTKAYKSMDEVMDVNEVRAAKALEHHPNVIGIREILFDTNHQTLYLISDLFDMNLYDYIKNRKRCLSELRVKNFLYQMVCGLNHLHRHGIFHRDIKPENILIKIDPAHKHNPMKAELIQLADLGSTASIAKKPPHSAYISTRWYRSPESLLTAGFYGSKIDIWAIGCVFFELLTLHPLFPGDNELDQLKKIHDVVGVPSRQMFAKFRNTSIPYKFPKCRPTGLYSLVPGLSRQGTDVLKCTLQYAPDLRISAAKLFDHAYFDVFRLPKTRVKNKPPNYRKRDDSEFNDSSASMETHKSEPQRYSLSKSMASLSTRKTHSASTVIEQKMLFELKLKERLWGMNPGNAKDNLMRSINGQG